MNPFGPWPFRVLFSCPQVPDYLEFISQPMDFSTMRSKLESHTYRSVADLESDFHLMVSNCLLYNSKDTVFHRVALRLRDLGGAVLRHAQRQATHTGLDLSTGMHLSESPQKRDFRSCTWDDGKLTWCATGNVTSTRLFYFMNMSWSNPLWYLSWCMVNDPVQFIINV